MKYRMQWLLLALVVTTAVGVEYMAHQSRAMFGDLQALLREEEELKADWGRLHLEMSTWGAHARIEKLARDRLVMDVPGMENIEVVSQ